jgi:hypothetical protein
MLDTNASKITQSNSLSQPTSKVLNNIDNKNFKGKYNI